MITSYIGSVFLKAYNARQGTDYDGRQFFIDVLHPLFFDHDKYCLWPQNSPFVQGMKKGHAFTPAERAEKLQTLIGKIESLSPDASFAIGYAAEGFTGSTSGQVTGMPLPLEAEDVYLSWIGAGLSVGVQGGLAIMFDQPEILLAVYDGWSYYRALLNGIPQLEGNKIMTWNGCWLAHRFDTLNYNSPHPLDNWIEHDQVVQGQAVGFSTVGWAEILQRIAMNFPPQRLMGYVYGLGQTNTTIGFIPFELPQIATPRELYVKLFGMESSRAAVALFGTSIGFERCCQRGSIGLRAMEPSGLREIMDGRKTLKYKPDDPASQIQFQTYITWIMAMLNNEERWETAREIASQLHEYALDVSRGKNTKSNEVEQLLTSSPSQSKFQNNLIPIIEKATDKAAILAIAELINKIPMDNVPYMITLIRMHYATIAK